MLGVRASLLRIREDNRLPKIEGVTSTLQSRRTFADRTAFALNYKETVEFPALSGSADHLMHTKNIAFWISKPCRLLGTENANLLYGLQTGEIVIVENHPSDGQFAHRFRGISDFKAEGGVIRFGALRLREQRERPAADREQMLPIATLTGIRQPEYI
jgi:hypothetical protein